MTVQKGQAMATARTIMRGTFRLSVAVAVLAAVYGCYEQWAAFTEAEKSSWTRMMTLECGAKLSEETLKPAANQYGLIDLGKVGCADRQFWASSDELLQARKGVMRSEWMKMEFSVRHAVVYSLAYAVLSFLVVNLLGLALIALRSVFGWIATGYKPDRRG
jgi:hypothetical protein